MPRGWAPPGQAVDPQSWAFDLKTGWQPPGSTHDLQQTQYGLGPGAAPGPDAPPWSLLTSPPGVPAPKEHINYTPQTGEMHPPGQVAPVHQTNLSMIPADLATAETSLRRAPNPKTKNTGIMDEIKGLLSGMGAPAARPRVGSGAAMGPYGSTYPTPFSAVPPTDDEGGAYPTGGNAPASPSGGMPEQSSAGGPAPDGTYPGGVTKEQFDAYTANGYTYVPGSDGPQGVKGIWAAPSADTTKPTKKPTGSPRKDPNAPGWLIQDYDDGTSSYIEDRSYQPPGSAAKPNKKPVGNPVRDPSYPGYLKQQFDDGSVEYITDRSYKPPSDAGGGQTQPRGYSPVQLPDGSVGIFNNDTGEIVNTIPAEVGSVSFQDAPDGGTLIVDQTGRVVQYLPPKPPEQLQGQQIGNDLWGLGPDGQPTKLVDNPDRMSLSDGSVVEIGDDGQMYYIYRAPQRMTIDGRVIQFNDDGTTETVYETPNEPNQPWLQRELHNDNPDLYPDPGVGQGQDMPPGMEPPDAMGSLGATLQKSLRPTQAVPTGATLGPGIDDAYGMFPGQAVVGAGAAQPDINGASGFVSPVDPGEVVGTGHRFGEQVDLEGTHKGIDLQAVRGTPVKAPVSGTVDRIDNEPEGLGVQVVIRDLEGKEHVLAHLDEVLVEPGTDVTAGTIVGAVGDSGAGATGPHLDYRRRLPGGDYEDPSGDLGPLAQMPRADAGAPGVGVGADWQFGDPGIPPIGWSGGGTNQAPPVGADASYWFPESNGGGGGGGGGGQQSPYGDAPPGMNQWQTEAWLAWKQLQEQMQQHQDLLKYQQMTFQQQQEWNRINAELQRQQMLMTGIIAPILQAAYNHPWLQSLAGMMPALGQPMGPNGSPSARLGAGKGVLATLAQEMGLTLDGSTGFDGEKPKNLWGKNGKNRVVIAAQNPETGQTQGITHHQNYLDISTGDKVKRAGYDTQTGDDLLKQGIAVGGITQRDALKGKIDWETYAQLTPYQRAALRTDIELRAPETGVNWGDYTNMLRENWAGKKRDPVLAMPEMTQLHAATQTPEQRIGTEQLADTFGQPAGQFWGQQQKTWSRAAGSNVFQQA